MSKHALTPWSVEKEFERRFDSLTGALTQTWKYWIRPAGQQFELVAHVTDYIGRGEANSAYIVKCVNSHAALVAALSHALACIGDLQRHAPAPEQENERALVDELVDEMKMALALARGGEQ